MTAAEEMLTVEFVGYLDASGFELVAEEGGDGLDRLFDVEELELEFGGPE